MGTILVTVFFTSQIVIGLIIKYGFDRARTKSTLRSGPSRPTTTILVAGKNEAENLENLFSSFDQQDASIKEIIYVDDGSKDNSLELLKKYSRPELHVLSITSSQGKKAALRKGLKHVSTERVLLTDADCRPMPNWITAHQGQPKEILVGYAPLHSSGLLGEIVAHETFQTASLTAAAIGIGHPYMATGRNWSFPSELFEKAGGYDGIDQGISGDDDLLLQKLVRLDDAECNFVFDNESFVNSNGPDGFKNWIRQKRRHSSAGRYYPWKVKAALAGIQLCNISMWLLPLLVPRIGGIALVAFLLLKYFVFIKAAREALIYKLSFPRFVIRELMYALYNLLVIPIGLLAPPKKW